MLANCRRYIQHGIKVASVQVSRQELHTNALYTVTYSFKGPSVPTIISTGLVFSEEQYGLSGISVKREISLQKVNGQAGRIEFEA